MSDGKRFTGWQYVAYYINDELKSTPTRLVCLARRRLPKNTDRDGSEGGSMSVNWQTIVFGDYDQTLNDGHNVGARCSVARLFRRY